MNTNKLLGAPSLLLVLVFGLAACSGGGGDDEPAPDAGPIVDAPPLADGSIAETCAAADLAPCTPTEATGDADGILFKGTVIGEDSITCSGQVLVSRASGRIVCVGQDCASDPGAAGAAVVCGDVISPGLIDAHSHLNYNHLPRFQHEGRLFEQRSNWQGDDAYHEFVDANYDIRDAFGCETMKWAEVRQILGGGTAALGSYGNACIDKLLRNLDDSDASGFGNKVEYIIFVDRADADLPDHLDSGGAAAIHLAEGVNQGSRDNEWDDLIAASLLRPGVSLIHGTALAASQLAELGVTPASLMWSPRSNLDLYGLTSPVTAAKHLGVPLALGTDWTPSGSLNMLDELRCADTLNRRYYDGTFTDRELVAMATIAGARGLLADEHIGRLAVGLEADVTVFRGDRTRPYRAIIDADNDDVALVMIAGRPTYGDAELLSGLAIEPELCEDLDVCGRARRICVQQTPIKGADKYHQSLSEVRTILEGALGAARTASGCTGDGCYMFDLEVLFSCERPPEDACFPGTADIPGVPSAGDQDGDGVADGDDLCPRIFDPPFDGGDTQEDADADGEGDACDLCPLTTDTVCPLPDVNDFDGDGAANDDDNCPRLANPDQADGDVDMIGDACDACPASTVATCATIPAIRQPLAVGHPRVGQEVTITGVVITAIDSTPTKGFSIWVQDPAATTFAGLRVYYGSTPITGSPAVGDTVTVSGIYDQFYNEDELTSPVLTITDTNTSAPAAILVPAADLATGGAMAEPYESMLVRVAGVAVTTANPDAPDRDYDEVLLTGNLRMDDLILDGCDPADATPATGCPADAPRTLPYGVGTTFTSVTGILGYTFSNHKLCPRTLADIVTP